MQINAGGRHPLGRFGGEQLCHGGLGHERLTGILQSRGVVNEEPCSFDLGSHFGELELDALEGSDRPTKLLSFPNIPDGVVESALREAHHLCTDADPPFV